MKRPMRWLILLALFAWTAANRAIPDVGWLQHVFFTLSGALTMLAIEHAYLPPRKRGKR